MSNKKTHFCTEIDYKRMCKPVHQFLEESLKNKLPRLLCNLFCVPFETNLVIFFKTFNPITVPLVASTNVRTRIALEIDDLFALCGFLLWKQI